MSLKKSVNATKKPTKSKRIRIGESELKKKEY